MGRSVGREVCVTSRVPALAPARTWLRRVVPVPCAAFALLAMGAAGPSTSPSTAGNAAQRSAAPGAEASLLSTSATRMLPDPRASSPPEAAITSPPGKLLTADVLVVSGTSLPAGSDAAVRRGPGVVAAGAEVGPPPPPACLCRRLPGGLLACGAVRRGPGAGRVDPLAVGREPRGLG